MSTLTCGGQRYFDRATRAGALKHEAVLGPEDLFNDVGDGFELEDLEIRLARGQPKPRAQQKPVTLDPAVERARVGCDAVLWQGETTLRAPARKEEQRRQRADLLRAIAPPKLELLAQGRLDTR